MHPQPSKACILRVPQDDNVILGRDTRRVDDGLGSLDETVTKRKSLIVGTISLTEHV